MVLRLLFDFGLVVLVWMVQLIVYPSFLYYSEEKLKEWHRKYTFRISLIVIPLILGQLFLALFQLWKVQSVYTIGGVTLIALVWISTFTQFAPVHAKLDSAKDHEKMLAQLVKRNWLRTFLWTIIFVWTYINFSTT